MKKLMLLACFALATGCISTKNTIKNIDDTAVMPGLSKEKNFIITETAPDDKYGYNNAYPVNLGFMPYQTAEINVKRFFGALSGPKGEKLTYTKTDACCPFPTKKYDVGAGVLDIYEVTWDGLDKPVVIYINLYEKSKVMAPKGFTIRKVL